MFAPLVALSALASYAYAQDNAAALEVASIDAQFDAAYIVPDMLESFDPIAYLTVSYGGEEVAAGTLLTTDESTPQPEITITPANSSVTLPSLYTIAMVDPGPIGGDFTQGQTRHWLVNGVTVEDGRVVVPEGGITPYGGPYPPEENSPHRYTILLFEQPDSFAPEGDLATPGQPIAAMDINEYASSSGLGPIVAGWYFTCTRGDAVAVTTTSAVDTATLVVPGGDESGSNTGSGTRTGSQTGTPTGGAGGDSAGFTNTVSLSAAGAMAFLGFMLA